jgi:glycosyltransferase involved in cell wall biosynthesis
VSPTNRWFSRLKCPSKTRAIIRMSRHVISVNEIIGGYVRRLNPAVTIVPNCVDVDRMRPTANPNLARPVFFGWVGSHSTSANLRSISGPLARIQEEYGARVRLIGSGLQELPGVSCEIVEWTPDTELTALQDCDVGLLPVPDHPWSDWKFYFKAVQYMAVGLPVVAQRKGSNATLIEDGVTGFLVETLADWYEALAQLARDAQLRRRMGTAGRQVVVERFSLADHLPRVVGVMNDVAAQDSRKCHA